MRVRKIIVVSVVDHCVSQVARNSRLLPILSVRSGLNLPPCARVHRNKLGATQANSAQSEESLHAYHQALETRPNYVRAWINVGMSFVNQGNYNDACQYYLRYASSSSSLAFVSCSILGPAFDMPALNCSAVSISTRKRYTSGTT